jgi:hypothetical protein
VTRIKATTHLSIIGTAGSVCALCMSVGAFVLAESQHLRGKPFEILWFAGLFLAPVFGILLFGVTLKILWDAAMKRTLLIDALFPIIALTIFFITWWRFNAFLTHME